MKHSAELRSELRPDGKRVHECCFGALKLYTTAQVPSRCADVMR